MTVKISVRDYKKRNAAPDGRNPYYLKQPHGFNKALEINERTHSVLPNCCGWAHGRWLEIGSFQNGDRYPSLCRGDAKNYYGYDDGYPRSKTPRVGDIACWKGGQYGHVAIVEEVYSSGTILVSNSAYGGEKYYTRKLKPPYNYTGSMGAMTFQGFIKCPYVVDGTVSYTTENVTPSHNNNNTLYGIDLTPFQVAYQIVKKGVELILKLTEKKE